MLKTRVTSFLLHSSAAFVVLFVVYLAKGREISRSAEEAAIWAVVVGAIIAATTLLKARRSATADCALCLPEEDGESDSASQAG